MIDILVWILFALIGFVVPIIFLVRVVKATYTSHLGRIAVIIGAATFMYIHKNFLDQLFINTQSQNLQALLIFVDGFCPFIIKIIGVLYAIIEVAVLISSRIKSKQPAEAKPLSDTTKWILTAILFVLAMVCICTGVLAPMAFAFRDAIKGLWKDNASKIVKTHNRN